MNLLNLLCDYLAEHGLVLLTGSSCLLILGCAGMFVERSPIHRQRAGELAVLAVLLWAALALVPLPRLDWSTHWPAPLFGPEVSADAGIAADAHPAGDAKVAFRSARAASLRGAEGQERAAFAERKATVVDSRVPRSAGSVPTAVGRGDIPPELRAESLAEESIGGTGGAILGLRAAELRAWLARAYFAGFAACVGWLVLGRVLLKRVLRRARAPEPWLAAIYDGMAPPGRRRPRLLVSSGTTRAFSLGLWRPTIVLPRSICRADEAAVGHVLRHELAHARQGDAWGQLLFNLAFPALYFHPLYWWLRVRAQLAAELVADDRAAAPEAKESYVQALVGLARERSRPGILCFSGRGMSSSPSQFCRRMQMLLVRKNPLAYRCSWRWRLLYAAACIVAVAAAAGTLGVPPVEAQVPDPTQAEAGVLKKEIASLQEKNAALQKQVADLQARLNSLAPKAQAAAARRSTRIYQLRGSDPRSLAVVENVLRTVLSGARVAVMDANRSVVVDADEDQQKMAARLIEELEQVAGKARTDAGGAVKKPVWHAPADSQTVAIQVARDVQDERATRILELLRRLAPTATVVADKEMLTIEGNRGNVETMGQLIEEILALVRQSQGRDRSQPGARLDQPALDTSQLDLVSLANSYSDALEKLEIAVAESKGAEELAKQKAVSQQEARRAAIILKAAERRVALLRSIAGHAIRAAKLDVELLQVRVQEAEARRQAGRTEAAEILELKARLMRAESQLGMLQGILAQK